nr:hypothetical protein [Tanacetum cinerariifolium]
MPVHIIVKDMRTMDMIIDQQVALDEALVPYASRLRIGKSNFHPGSDITSKESTLQLVYDVLRLTPFYKAFLVTTDVPEIYILPNQTFDELLFGEEILAFLRYPGYSEEIKKLTDVNINKLHQLWRSFTAVINKCLSGKSTGYDSLRNKVNWHYVKDDQMFITIKLVSRHQNTQKFGAILLVELTNEDIKNSAAYKEYYAIASGAAPPKTKASSSNEDDDDEIDDRSDDQEYEEDQDDDDDDQDDNDDDQDTNNDSEDFVHPKLTIYEEEVKDEESFDPIVQTPENYDDEGNDNASLGMNVGDEEGQDAEDDDEELYRDVNINLEGRDIQMTDVHTTQEFEDTHVTLTSLTPRVDVQASTTVASLTLTAPTLPPLTIPTISQFAGAVSSILGIVERYMDQRMNEAVKSLVELEFFLKEVYKETTDQLDWNNPEGQQYPHNLIKPLPLIPNSRGRRIIPFDHFINNDLEYLRGGASSRKYTTSVTKTKAADYGHIKWIEDLIVEWHNYKHLDWITMRRDDDKLYKFKEGDFKRLHIQDIEDMLLLLVQGKLINLTVKERFAFNVSLRIHEKHHHPTTCGRSSTSDGTLNDVQTHLDDHLKGIRMKYLPHGIWRKSEKERAASMIQSIDKQLKTRGIMQSLEKFIGGRLYEGDFRMLQQTI